MSLKVWVTLLGLTMLFMSLVTGHLVGAELRAGLGWGIGAAVSMLILLLVGVIWFFFFRDGGPPLTGH